MLPLSLISPLTLTPNKTLIINLIKSPKITFNPTKTKTKTILITRAQKNPDDNKNTKTDGPDEVNKNGRPRLNLRWVDLVLDPDPDNVIAVGLTGVLAWASVQIIWQLFFISFSICVAALKYSFIAALLVFILITLL